MWTLGQFGRNPVGLLDKLISLAFGQRLTTLLGPKHLDYMEGIQ